MQLMMNPVGQGAKKEEPEMEDPGPPSSNMDSPNYRPENMEHIPGLTDRRYCGAMKDWFDDKGFGFVECGELKQKFPTTDVFLHENQRKNYVKGDWVWFNIFLNFRGKPQATALTKWRWPKSMSPRN